MLFFLCILSVSLSAQTYPQTFTKQLKLTVGVPTLINPYADIGIPASSAMGPNQFKKNGQWVYDANAYQISPVEGDFVVTSSSHKGHYSYSTQYYYYSYTLTPQAAGTYTFYQGCKWVIGTFGGGGTSGLTNATYTLNVVELTDVSIPTTLSLGIHETYTFSPTYIPTGATSNPIWTSSNETVATISAQGELTTCGFGETTITCTAHNGLTAQCVVTVSNGLYAPDISACYGSQVTLPIRLANTENISGLQFNLTLPEGVSVATKEMSNARGASHIVSSNKDPEADNTYIFTVLSMTGDVISGNEGTLVNVTLQVDDNVAIGQYPITIDNIVLTKSDETKINPNTTTSQLNVIEVTMGDVNNDGGIDIADAIGIVNHILKKTASTFVTGAADLNNDGVIDIADAIAVVNIILKK